LEYWLTLFEIYKHVVKSKMQENNFCVYGIHAKTHFLKPRIFVFLKKRRKFKIY